MQQPTPTQQEFMDLFDAVVLDRRGEFRLRRDVLQSVTNSEASRKIRFLLEMLNAQGLGVLDQARKDPEGFYESL